MKRGDLESALQSPASFVKTLLRSTYRPALRAEHTSTHDLFTAQQ